MKRRLSGADDKWRSQPRQSRGESAKVRFPYRQGGATRPGELARARLRFSEQKQSYLKLLNESRYLMPLAKLEQTGYIVAMTPD
jgi:hypothetical protein